MVKKFYTKAFLEEQAKKAQEIQKGSPKDGPVVEDKKLQPIVERKKREPMAKPKPKSSDLRALEISQLCLGYPDLTATVSPENISTVSFSLPITDPEFPYDLGAVELSIQLHANYPSICPTFFIRNETIPRSLIENIEGKMNGQVKRLPSGEMSVRPMLKYLLNNLESFLAASKASIKFVVPSDHTTPTEATTEHQINKQVLMMEESMERLKFRETRFEPGSFVKLSEPKPLGSGSFGMECVFGDVSGFSVAVCTLLSLTIICVKCNQSNDLDNIRPESSKQDNCVKCRRQFAVDFFPEYVIGRTKRKLGQCKFSHCRPLDLLPSQWYLECDNCNTGVRVNKVNMGERITWPCRTCGTVLLFTLEGCRWSEVQHVSSTHNKKTPTRERVSVTVGEPLPKHGTCDHYSKSFRWYRFPCCGRVFPCDKCHEECKLDTHVMEWATRFICGHCSREQHINQLNKVCVCGVDPKAKHTAHWEGGKGMRNQVTMSKKDNKKYRGTNK